MSTFAITSANQHKYVNYQQNDNRASATKDVVEKKAPSSDIAIIKVGDEQAQEQADTLFYRADAYAKLSMQTQRMLNSYEGVALNEKREAVSRLMGVDVFA